MSKAFRNNYLLLGISILSLVAGLILAAQKQEAASVFSYAVGAAIGLGLSILLLIRALKNGEFGSDVLALISITATALTNEWLAASVITVMLATGRALERWAEGRARKQLEALLKRAPQFAHLIDSDGQIRDVALNQVAIGDRLLVRSGEVVPIDGTMLTSGSFDQSALTGEPIPVFIAPGEMVQSGVLNSDNQVEISASCTAGFFSTRRSPGKQMGSQVCAFRHTPGACRLDDFWAGFNRGCRNRGSDSVPSNFGGTGCHHRRHV
ncbi:MAG: hypothetical protein RL716_716 [Actinomycetota bacterium]